MVRDRTKTVSMVVAGALVVACGACSVLFSTSEDQCATDGDCTARGGAFAAMHCSQDSICVSTTDVASTDASTTDAAPDPFACATLPAASPDPSKQLDMTMRYTDFSTGSPPVNTLARLCASTDLNCENPRASLEGAGSADAGPEGGTGWVTVNVDGTVRTKIELGFEGFFEVRAPQYPPTFRSTSPALRNPTNDLEQLLLRPAEIKFLADEALGKPGAYHSDTHGLVFVFARDCNQAPIPSASFTTNAEDPLMQLFYIINSAPSIQDTKSDSLGRGGYVNVPPGLHTFSAFLGEGEAKKRVGTARVFVRAGAATTIAVTPSQ
jgi:hypothetical protein